MNLNLLPGYLYSVGDLRTAYIMFTVPVQSQCSFPLQANDENNLPPKIGIQGDGGLCRLAD